MSIIAWQELNPVVSYANELECLPSYTFGPRIIYEHQFIYIVKGKGRAIIQNRSYEARGGDLFYYGPHVVHQFIADELQPYTVLGIHFSFNGRLPDTGAIKDASTLDVLATYSYPPQLNANTLEKIGAGQLKIPEHCHPGTTWAQDLLYQITLSYNREESVSPLYNRSLFTQFLIQLQRWSSHSNLLMPDQFKVVTYVRSQLELYAELAYNRKWLNEWTQYNEDYVSRMFRNQYGESPHQYHLDQKIQAAKRLLALTDLTVDAISESLQIGTVQNFFRQFKKNTGHTPTTYRNLRRMI